MSCCVLQSPLAHKAPLFEHFRPSLYEERWHEVLRVVLEIWPLLGTLRLTWDSQHFSAEAVQREATAGPFTASWITSALQDALFLDLWTLSV